MLKLSDLSRLKGFRLPRSVIGYAVWAYHRFALSLRDVEDLLASRGITVSYETIQDWVARFGIQFAGKVRRDRPRSADKWHLDEVVVPIKGRKHWLWRAVDANDDVLDILVQSRRNTAAALRFFRKLFKVWGQPRVIVTDTSPCPTAARIAASISASALALCWPKAASPSSSGFWPSTWTRRGLNNRIEGSHRPTRRREQIMGRFKSARQAQRFLAAHDQINTIFKPRRYRLTANSYRYARADAFSLWTDYAHEMTA